MTSCFKKLVQALNLFIDIELSEIISFEVVITSIITERDAYTLLMENFALEWLLVKSDLEKSLTRNSDNLDRYHVIVCTKIRLFLSQ